MIDDELDDLLPSLPAIALEGPRGVGKTETARRRASTVLALDDPAAVELVAADPVLQLRRDPPVLVDEWQQLPAVWDAVRREVDRDSTPSRFLLTGSAAPSIPPTHSGAGRIVSLRMRPLALSERQRVDPTVSLTALLSGSVPDVGGRTTLTLTDYVDEILASGFPAIRGLPPRARRAQLDGYVRRVVDRDVNEGATRARQPHTLRRWLAAYAAATATVASLEALRDAATGDEGDKPSKTTTFRYREALERLWLIEPLPAWLPTRNHFTKLGAAPKLHLADPALAARLLDVDHSALLGATDTDDTARADAGLLGRLFESLVTLSVRVYAQHAEATTHHLRTHSGTHEIDLIVGHRAGRVLAIEVKLGGAVSDRDVRQLHWLRETIGHDLIDAVVVTTGPQAYRRPDGIAVVPAALLGP